TVEFYDFFGKVLWARAAVPTPASLGPGETATLSLSTPRLESMSRAHYRFEYARGSAPRGHQREISVLVPWRRRGLRARLGRAILSRRRLPGAVADPSTLKGDRA